MAESNLKALLRRDAASQPAELTVETVPARGIRPEVPAAGTDESEAAAPAALACIDSIEVEAVVGGALQRIRFRRGTNPADVARLLLSLDPGAKVRDGFPMKGGGGHRETKAARAVVVDVRATDAGVFWSLVAQATDGEDLTCSVSRNKSGDFLGELTGLGRLSERSIAKLEAAVSGKKAATLILSEDEQFGVKYWVTDDGAKAFVDGLTPDAPEVAAQEGSEG